MLNFNKYDDFLNYLCMNIICEESSTCIVLEETANDIIAQLHDYIGSEVNSYITISNNEEEIYVISKTKCNDGIELVIEPLHRDEDIKNIEDELVIIADDILSEDDINKYIETKELKIVGLEYNQKYKKDEIYTCEECMKDNDYCDCENCYLDNEQIDEEEQELESFLEDFVERVQETEGCPHCIMDILKEVYCRGYVSGSEEEALNLYNALHERLYGED